MFLDDTREGMWKLPDSENGENLLATSNAYHISTDAQLSASMHRPLMRYRNIKATECSMAQHKNNHDHPVLVYEAEKDVSKSCSKFNLQHNGVWGEQIEDKDEEALEQVNGAEDGAEEEGKRYYYSVNFGDCKVGSLCVGVAEYENKGQGLFVGRVKSRDEEKECFETQEYKCNVDVWTQKCVEGKWYYDPRAHTTTTENFSVICYFQKLNTNCKIPKTVQKEINLRNIKWGK